MVLTPLINHALAHRSKRLRSDDVFTIDVVLREAALYLTVHDQGAGFAPESEGDQGIQRIRERLAALYGERAGLTLTADGNTTSAVVEIPCGHLGP
jgi:LytS/YehU family sensor histidine kinase